MQQTVLIVDDHAGFRRSARALLQAEGFNVVGEAADGTTAITESLRLRPAVVLLDIQLPDLDGFIVAEHLSMSPEPPAVILISSHSRSSFEPELATTRARGFIPKSGLSGAALNALLE